MINHKKNKIAALLIFIVLSACSPEPDSTQAESPNESVDASAVLATVNGDAITQDDVDFMISRTFSGSEQLFFDDKMQAKVLDSLIASKAMMQKMQSSLDQEKIVDINYRTKAFKEELFVKEYLLENATPVPVSSSMVSDYYQQYPEEFGGGERREFEMLATVTKPTEQTRDAILKATKAIQENNNWADFAKSNDLGLSHKKATMLPGLFNAEIESAVKNTKLNQTSNVVFVKGQPHFIRVSSVSALPAKPLSEVSAQIRKKLAALQLKKAVKQASTTAISDAEVVRQ